MTLSTLLFLVSIYGSSSTMTTEPTPAGAFVLRTGVALPAGVVMPGVWVNDIVSWSIPITIGFAIPVSSRTWWQLEASGGHAGGNGGCPIAIDCSATWVSARMLLKTGWAFEAARVQPFAGIGWEGILTDFPNSYSMGMLTGPHISVGLDYLWAIPYSRVGPSVALSVGSFADTGFKGIHTLFYGGLVLEICGDC